MDLQIIGKQSAVNRALDEFDTVEEGGSCGVCLWPGFQVNSVVVHSVIETFLVYLLSYLQIPHWAEKVC
jgi:hypothetical protein